MRAAEKRSSRAAAAIRSRDADLAFALAAQVLSFRAHVSDPRFGKARRARGLRALAQVEPPGEAEADRVEAEIDRQRELRPAGHRDRLAEAERDQEAADRADGADEAYRST